MAEAAGIITLLYVITILALTIGWFRIKRWKKDDTVPKTNISVVIPVRNEADNIGELLTDLLNQSYPKELHEVILVDDNSEDKTVEIVNDYRHKTQDARGKTQDARGKTQEARGKRQDERLEIVRNDGEGKKEAIRKGVEIAEGDLIVTTDADCRVGPEWLSSIASYYEKYNPKLISGPVILEKTYGFFKSFQSMELMSLVASGAGAIGINRPIMCNGANLAFEKEAYLEVNNDKKDLKYASGDDIFMLLKIKKLYGGRSVRFLKNQDAIVETSTKDSIREYFNQRFRWVSKSKGYRDPAIIIVALIVFLFNLSLLTCSILVGQFDILPRITAAMWIIKVIVDLPILLGFSMFARRDNVMGYYFIFAIGYVLFATVMAVVGNLPLGYSWKGRKIRN